MRPHSWEVRHAPQDRCGKVLQLTTHPSYDDSPVWSLDRTRLAFTSARSGRMDIYVMDLDVADPDRQSQSVAMARARQTAFIFAGATVPTN